MKFAVWHKVQSACNQTPATSLWEQDALKKQKTLRISFHLAIGSVSVSAEELSSKVFSSKVFSLKPNSRSRWQVFEWFRTNVPNWRRPFNRLADDFVLLMKWSCLHLVWASLALEFGVAWRWFESVWSLLEAFVMRLQSFAVIWSFQPNSGMLTLQFSAGIKQENANSLNWLIERHLLHKSSNATRFSVKFANNQLPDRQTLQCMSLALNLGDLESPTEPSATADGDEFLSVSLEVFVLTSVVSSHFLNCLKNCCDSRRLALDSSSQNASGPEVYRRM